MLDRRTLLITTAAAFAGGFASTTEATPATCPLLGLIVAYRAALDDFNTNAPDDDEGGHAYSEATFWPVWRLIAAYDQPALSLPSAIEAIRLARDEERTGNNPLVASLLNAAVAYFDNQARA